MAQRNISEAGRPDTEPLLLEHPNAAGIDIGSRSHFVAVPSGRDAQPVREYGCMTADLHALADWLQACKVTEVAMESTGVYWIPAYEVLERRGFTVLLVNARHIKGMPGRKSDVLDCQWLQRLMAYGLLRGAYRPSDQVCVLRSLSRQREQLLRSQARSVQHMQKALTQMNIQLATVISDVVGQTGQAIVRAMVAGERDPAALAALKGTRIKASGEQIERSLQGNWREEHLFALAQALQTFDFVGGQIQACDEQIQQQLARLQAHEGEPAKGKKRSRSRNTPAFDIRTHLYQVCGVDLTRIDGIDVSTALVLVAEVGPDLSRFATAGHFASWLGLCPGTKITGGKVLSGRTRPVVNRASQALRLAAAALRTSQSALGAYYRRLCGRMDRPKAVTAAAHKLARLVYTMLTRGEAYTDQGQAYYEERHRERVLYHLNKRAEQMGMKLVANPIPL